MRLKIAVTGTRWVTNTECRERVVGRATDQPLADRLTEYGKLTGSKSKCDSVADAITGYVNP